MQVGCGDPNHYLVTNLGCITIGSPIHSDIVGQSYKASTSVNYDSRVILTSKLLIFMTVDSYITIVEA